MDPTRFRPVNGALSRQKPSQKKTDLHPHDSDLQWRSISVRNRRAASSACSTSITLQTPPAEEIDKILIFDPLCCDILSTLVHVEGLRKHGVTLYFLIDKERQMVRKPLPSTSSNIQRIIADVSRGLYQPFHLNFLSLLPRPLLEDLALGILQSDSVHRIGKIWDQYLEFITLEENMFSLAQRTT
ncbi:hypothetical protein ACLOJK_013340 [Asimina triloba]